MIGRIYNDDAFAILRDVANECDRPVIVTDPPFNIGYHYASYSDSMDNDEYFHSMSEIVCEYPCVIIHYPESLHRISMESAMVPNRVVSWVYPSNTRRQHRDIAFYGIEPDFEAVRRPYKNPNDKRIKELVKRTGGGRVIRWIAHMDGITVIDPFAGSGTTCVACEMHGIPWRAIEIDGGYCSIIEQRIMEVEDGLA